MKQTLKSICFLFLISVYVKQGKSKNIQSPSTRHYIVVFDIDDTLCKPGISSEELKFAQKKHPECPIIHWAHDGRDYPHIFLPYLQILFDYLLEKGVRIVFFSSAIKERNMIVIPELLTSFWGSKKYEGLKSKGQFSIYSREALREGGKGPGEGTNVKDLKVVVQDGESLSDCILVEDDESYAAHDQRPCLYIINLSQWHIYDDSSPCDFPKNSTYYMLGLFKTYFEHDKYKKFPLREGLAHILPTIKDDFYHHFFEEHPFARKMIEMGISEVQKVVPNATLCGSFKEKSMVKKLKERFCNWFSG